MNLILLACIKRDKNAILKNLTVPFICFDGRRSDLVLQSISIHILILDNTVIGDCHLLIFDTFDGQNILIHAVL